MRFIPIVLILFLLFSCGPDGHESGTEKITTVDTNLRLPSLVAGMMVDTTLASLRISTRYEFISSDSTDSAPFAPTLLVEFDSASNTETVNVYADSAIASGEIDSILNIYCSNKDLCLIGISNGQELAIPFHTLHRFPAVMDTLYYPEPDVHLFFVERESVNGSDLTQHFRDGGEYYFRLFYGDAFNPNDSALFPSRESNRQTVDQLMLEGQGWDNVNFKSGTDSAQKLAAYNEFVNKLEIYDKVGSFCTLRKAFMTMDGEQYCNWGRLVNVFSVHYNVVHSLQENAKKYLADKIANEGGDPNKLFTEEDLELLYPDRLVWSNRISGEHEHRYDPFMVADWLWTY